MHRFSGSRLAGVGVAGLALALLIGPTRAPADGAPPADRTSPSSSGSADAQVADPTDWITYHYDQKRQGYDPTAATASGTLSTAWQVRLDGAVYAEPLVYDDHIIVVTENDSVYSLDLTGHVEWRRNVGTPVPLSELPCGNIDPLGITGTPMYRRDDRCGLLRRRARRPDPPPALRGRRPRRSRRVVARRGSRREHPDGAAAAWRHGDLATVGSGCPTARWPATAGPITGTRWASGSTAPGPAASTGRRASAAPASGHRPGRRSTTPDTSSSRPRTARRSSRRTTTATASSSSTEARRSHSGRPPTGRTRTAPTRGRARLPRCCSARSGSDGGSSSARPATSTCCTPADLGGIGGQAGPGGRLQGVGRDGVLPQGHLRPVPGRDERLHDPARPEDQEAVADQGHRLRRCSGDRRRRALVGVRRRRCSSSTRATGARSARFRSAISPTSRPRRCTARSCSSARWTG